MSDSFFLTQFGSDKLCMLFKIYISIFKLNQYTYTEFHSQRNSSFNFE